MPKQKTRKLYAKVIATDAEKSGKDFGIGNGVLGIAELTCGTDPERAAIAMSQKSDDILSMFVRIEWTDKKPKVNNPRNYTPEQFWKILNKAKAIRLVSHDENGKSVIMEVDKQIAAISLMGRKFKFDFISNRLLYVCLKDAPNMCDWGNMWYPKEKKDAKAK